LAYEAEETIDYTDKVSYVIENDIPVLIYAGEFDVLDGPRTIEDWLKNIQLVKDDPTFFGQARNVYYIQDDDGNELVGGYYRQVPLLSWLTVPKAGHFVPNNYMLASKFFIADFIKDK